MSAILDRAKAHFAAIPRREIKVPEWGSAERPAVVTWTAMSVRDQERIYAPDGEGRAPSGGLVRLRAVMLKACDETGRPMFDDMDEHALRYEVDGDVIGRIANAILFGAGLVDAAGKTTAAGDQVDAAKNA